MCISLTNILYQEWRRPQTLNHKCAEFKLIYTDSTTIYHTCIKYIINIEVFFTRNYKIQPGHAYSRINPDNNVGSNI